MTNLLHSDDAPEPADLLNAILVQGRITALETPFSAVRVDGWTLNQVRGDGLALSRKGSVV